MATSELQYLKEIADHLKRMAGKDNSDTAKAIAQMSIQQTKIDMSTGNQMNVNLENVTDKLDKGLLATVEEEQGGQTVEVVKSLLELMRTALVKVIHDAFTVTVTEDDAQVEKSMAQLLYEQNAELTNIRKALDGTTQNGIGAKIAHMDTTLGDIKTDQDAIKTALEGIDDSLDGTTTGGVADKLNDINTSLGGVSTNVASMASDTSVIRSDIGTGNSSIRYNVDLIQSSLGSLVVSDSSTVMEQLVAMKGHLNNISSSVATTNNKKITQYLNEINQDLQGDQTGTIYTHVKSIDTKTS